MAEDRIKPDHYQGSNGLEVFEVMKQFAPDPEWMKGFYWNNALKYLLRFHKKNGVEDLQKAKKYLEMLIEEAGGANEV